MAVGLFDFLTSGGGGSPLLSPAFFASDPAAANALNAMRTRAALSGLSKAGLGLIAAGGPSPNPFSFGRALGMGLEGFDQGYTGSFNNDLRQGLVGYQLAHAKTTAAREAETDRLRRAAIDEVQRGLPPLMPVRPAAATSPTGAPVDPVALNRAVDAATGMTVPGVYPASLGPVGPSGVGMQPDPNNPTVQAITQARGALPPVPMNVNDVGDRPGSTLRPNIPGIGPAMQAYLAASAPASYATLMHRDNRGVIVPRGAKMVNQYTGDVMAEGNPAFPRVRNFVIGDQVVPHQFDETTGEWIPIDGAGGPRFSPNGRGAGGLTVPQQRINEEIDTAREFLKGMDHATIIRHTRPLDERGLPNRDYDSQLAARVRMAARRKYGASDPEYENTYARLMTPEGPQPKGASADAGGSAIPQTSAGKIDTSKLQKGSVYRLPDGRRIRWDGMKFDQLQ